MQKNRTNRVIPPHQVSHHIDRLAKPYLIWLYVFALIPMVFMIFLMFIDSEGISLPFTATTDNLTILTEYSTLVALWNSIRFAFLTTIICIFFAMLVAYSLYKSKIKNKYLILLLLILPMWTNFLLRINAISSVFKENNIITSLLHIKGYALTQSDFGTDVAILLGMVFTYLPFMVLPIYTSLEKIDPLLHEATLDLGLTEFKKFWKLVVPMSMKGIISGSITVLLPCISGFAIPQVISNGKVMLIGNIIETSFKNMDYNGGSVLAVLLLIIILGSIFIINKNDKEGETLL